MSLQPSLTLNHQHKVEKDDPVGRSKERCLLQGDTPHSMALSSNTSRIAQHRDSKFTMDFLRQNSTRWG